jgi:hypothetical protein
MLYEAVNKWDKYRSRVPSRPALFHFAFRCLVPSGEVTIGKTVVIQKLFFFMPSL